MCSPAPVVLHQVEHSHRQPELVDQAPNPKAGRLNILRENVLKWLMGWKQTLIAELASLGSPKEGFL